MADDAKAPAAKEAPAAASGAATGGSGGASAGASANKKKKVKKAGPMNMILILAGGLMATAAAAAAVVFLVVIPKLQAASTAEHAVKSSKAELGPVFEIKDLVINSADQDELHYFKVGLAMETPDAKQLAEITHREPQIRDVLITEISRHTIRQLNSSEGREQVRRVLLERLNGQLGGTMLKRVFFTEYVAQ